MPIYVFRCESCAHQVEKIMKFSDPYPTECEKCGGQLEKVLFPPGLHFKGSGWYVTDYARKEQKSSSYTQSRKEEKSAAQSSGGSTET